MRKISIHSKIEEILKKTKLGSKEIKNVDVIETIRLIHCLAIVLEITKEKILRNTKEFSVHLEGNEIQETHKKIEKILKNNPPLALILRNFGEAIDLGRDLLILDDNENDQF